jgi:hypothetical protein
MIEVKFAQLLESYGVEASQTTKKINDLQSDFDDAWQDYQNLVEEAESVEDDNALALIEEQIEEYEIALREADAELVSAINKWYKMKDVWAENAKKMGQGRANKKNNANPNADVTQTVHYGQGNGSAMPIFNNANATNRGEVKKKSGGGFWLLAGLVAVVTLGAVVMKKD